MSETVPVTNTPPVRPVTTTRTTPKREKTLPVEAKSVVWNPTPEQLRQYAEQMPNARHTEFGNLNVATRVVSRSKLSTFIATDTP
jgi:hypothetical protein